MDTMRTVCTALVFASALGAGGCARDAAAPAESEAPTLDVTAWTDKTELFMEYPPLVAGEEALFAVHLTRLGDFTALAEGRPRLELTPESGGAPIVVPGNQPSRPGVFRVLGTMPAAGTYRWALAIDAPGLTDRHDLGRVTVFGDPASAAAQAAAVPEDASAISYLKEPQWTNGFATVVVQEAPIRRVIRVPASIDTLTGGEAVVSAPADGRFAAQTLLSIGARVAAGQEIGRLEPRLADGGADRATLVAAVAEAQARVEAARAERERADRLLAERAVPARRAEDAARALTVVDAQLKASEARLAQRDETLRSGGGAAAGNAFILRAPIAGRVSEVFAALGASYDEGTPLFRIVRTDRVELQALVPAADAPLPPGIIQIDFEVPGRTEPLVLDVDHQHDAGVIDPATRALAVQFDVDNRAGSLLIGQTGTAALHVRDVQRLPAVPRGAVLTEGGRPYVFVQIGGERFARRFIDMAGRDGDRVGVRSGVRPGERVVTRGAYDVQLASAAGGLPAEGHVH